MLHGTCHTYTGIDYPKIDQQQEIMSNRCYFSVTRVLYLYKLVLIFLYPANDDSTVTATERVFFQEIDLFKHIST